MNSSVFLSHSMTQFRKVTRPQCQMGKATSPKTTALTLCPAPAQDRDGIASSQSSKKRKSSVAKLIAIAMIGIAIAACGNDESARHQASVSVVEFADFQCPACRRFALLHWPSVKARFGDAVELSFRHWPQSYHGYAYSAAIAAVCAGNQDRFVQIHDLFYLEQPAIGHKPFREFARESGVKDLQKFERCLGSSDARAIVDDDIRAALEVGGVGTPTLLIDGVKYRLRADTSWLPHLIDSLLVVKR